MKKTGLLMMVTCLVVCFPLVRLAQSTDEASLTGIVKSFFDAYQKEDIEGIKKLWSEKSPEATSSRESFQQTFTASDDIEVKSIAIGKMGMEGEKATLRVVAEMSAVDAKTGNAARGFGKQNLTFHFVKEGGNWKLWRYVKSEEELAVSIVAAKSEEERKALLETEKDLITVELHRSLSRQAEFLSDEGDYEKAITVFQLAQKIAEQLDDKLGIAFTLRGIAVINFRKGSYTLAVDYYQRSMKIAAPLGGNAALDTLKNHPLSQSNYVERLDYYQKSLKIAELLGDKATIAATLNSIGLYHRLLGHYAQALDDYHKSLKIAEAIGDKWMIHSLLKESGLYTGCKATTLRRWIIIRRA